MAPITVKFYGLWQLQLGFNSIDLEAHDVDEALCILDTRFSQHLEVSRTRMGLKMEGYLRDNSVVLLNGIGLRNLKDTVLKKGDILSIFPPIGGG